MVQTSENWWKAAQMLRHVRSQEEMDLARRELSSVFKIHNPLNGRRLAFDLRWAFFNVYSRFFFGLPQDFNPFLPGLEVKYALEEASRLDSRVVYLGYEIDENTNTRLYHETRNSVLKALVNSWKFSTNVKYSTELTDIQSQINNYGLKKFLESSCDQFFINWYEKK